MRSYAAFNHKDSNHNSIVADLTRQGVEVAELMQPLDILAEYAGWTCFLEIKQPGSRAKFTRPQLAFIANSRRFNVAIVTDSDAAMRVMKTRAAITQTQKDRLSGFLMRNSEKFFTPKEIMEVLNR